MLSDVQDYSVFVVKARVERLIDMLQVVWNVDLCVCVCLHESRQYLIFMAVLCTAARCLTQLKRISLSSVDLMWVTFHLHVTVQPVVLLSSVGLFLRQRKVIVRACRYFFHNYFAWTSLVRISGLITWIFFAIGRLVYRSSWCILGWFLFHITSKVLAVIDQHRIWFTNW